MSSSLGVVRHDIDPQRTEQEVPEASPRTARPILPSSYTGIISSTSSAPPPQSKSQAPFPILASLKGIPIPSLPGIPKDASLDSNNPGGNLVLPGGIGQVGRSTTLSKYRVSPISDTQTNKIISGWDWFQMEGTNSFQDQVQLVHCGAIGDNSCFYHSTCKALLPEYQNEAEIIKYGSQDKGGAAYGIGEASGNKVYQSRQVFVDNFRRSIARWLCQPGVNPTTGNLFTEAEARRYLNTVPSNVLDMLETTVRSPFDIDFKPFQEVTQRSVLERRHGKDELMNRPYNWEYNLLEELFSDDSETRGRTILVLSETCLNRKAETASRDAVTRLIKEQHPYTRRTAEGIKATIDAAREARRLTPEILIGILRSTKITYETKIDGKIIKPSLFLTFEDVAALKMRFREETLRAANGSDDHYVAYRRVINNTLARGDSVYEALVGCGLMEKDGRGGYSATVSGYTEYIYFLQGYAKALCSITNELKAILGNPADPFHESYSHSELEKVAISDSTQITSFMINSINPITSMYWEPDQVSTVLDKDPRSTKGLDSESLELPININYFLLDFGSNITRCTYPNDSGQYTFRLSELLKVVLPEMSKGRIYRRDAGEEDIIPMMPFVVGVDIHLVNLFGDHMEVYRSYPEGLPRNCPNIVIHSTPGHFEVVGCLDFQGAVQTVFEPSHPFILAIREYTRLLNTLGKRHETVYQTLKVSKIPAAVHAMPYYLSRLPLPSRQQLQPTGVEMGGVSISSLPVRSVGILPSYLSSGGKSARQPGEAELEMLMREFQITKEEAVTIWHASRSPPKESMVPPNIRFSSVLPPIHSSASGRLSSLLPPRRSVVPYYTSEDASVSDLPGMPQRSSLTSVKSLPTL